MRIAPLATIIVLACAGPVASASQFQRGSVSSVTVEPGANEAAFVLTVRGSNPCRTVNIDYGDGTAETRDIGSLPASIRHEYTTAGSYRVVVRGTTNCAGMASATLRASLATIGGGRGGMGRGGMRFPGMDRNGDGRITRQEWRGSDQSFRVHDWNGDGVLSGDEVRTGGRRPNPEQDFSEDMFSDWTERGFNTLDRDRNSRITSNEWLYDFDTFVRVDRNGDNVLTRQEFLAADVGDTRAGRFDALDTNNNGRIERLEWRGTRDAFDILDRNNDGVLSRAEMVDEPGSDIDPFNSLDVNRDRVITRDEWQGSFFTFQNRDINRDGRLTRAEFDSTAPLDPSREIVNVSVRGDQRWTDTGLTVRAGEMLTFEASGQVYMTTGTDDAATPRGSVTGRYATGAPLRRELAGALIGRVEGLEPFFIGDRATVIRMPRDGRLFLGVNDDYFGDNRGEFRVTIANVR